MKSRAYEKPMAVVVLGAIGALCFAAPSALAEESAPSPTVLPASEYSASTETTSLSEDEVSPAVESESPAEIAELLPAPSLRQPRPREERRRQSRQSRQQPDLRVARTEGERVQRQVLQDDRLAEPGEQPVPPEHAHPAPLLGRRLRLDGQAGQLAVPESPRDTRGYRRRRNALPHEDRGQADEGEADQIQQGRAGSPQTR